MLRAHHAVNCGDHNKVPPLLLSGCGVGLAGGDTIGRVSENKPLM